MSDIVNDLWAERASELMQYLTTEEALDLNMAYERYGDFEELVARLERKYTNEREKDQQEALKSLTPDVMKTADEWLNGRESWQVAREDMSVDEKLAQDDVMADRDYEERAGK